ncbi:MAG: hypothetical protein JWN00_4869 [Actinomycetia bacterium]|jgi:hypothetical protein|nr:hypothetical protein [Actinomycetes bacterium]
MKDRASDEMWDDEQAGEVSLYEKYIEDPPDDLVIAEDEEQGSIGITEWTAQEASSRKDRLPEVSEPAEQAAIHLTDKP